MKIGIGVLAKNLPEGIEFYKNNSIINHLEIGVDNLSDCDELKKYAQILNDNELTIGIHLPLEINTCEEIECIRDSWVNYVNTIFEKTSSVNIEYYTLHLGYAIRSFLERDRKKYLRNTVDFLNKLENKKSVVIENIYTKDGEVCSIGTNVYDFEYIFKNTLNDNVKFCYDRGHDLINKSNYFKLYDKFKVIHLSDNDGTIDQHLGVSNGMLNEYMIKKALSSNAEYLVLEMELRYVKESISNLQQNFL